MRFIVVCTLQVLISIGACQSYTSFDDYLDTLPSCAQACVSTLYSDILDDCGPVSSSTKKSDISCLCRGGDESLTDQLNDGLAGGRCVRRRCSTSDALDFSSASIDFVSFCQDLVLLGDSPSSISPSTPSSTPRPSRSSSSGASTSTPSTLTPSGGDDEENDDNDDSSSSSQGATATSQGEDDADDSSLNSGRPSPTNSGTKFKSASGLTVFIASAIIFFAC